MNVLGLGPGELMLIAVLGLIIFGPGKLPEMAAQLGKAIRDLRQSSAEIRSEFQRSFAVDLQLDELKDELQQELKLDTALTGATPAPPETAPTVPADAVAATDERPLADIGAWHWEGSETASTRPPVPVAADVAYWEWDDARTARWSAREPLFQTIEWEWDDAPPITNGTENGAEQLAAVDQPALPGSPPAEASAAEAESGEPAPISSAGPGSS